MLRNIISKTGFITCGLIPTGFFEDADRIKYTTETEKKADISIVENETGRERVKKMFETDEFGNLSKEIETILSVGAMSLFVGAMYGGVIHSRIAYTDFIKNNQATAFNDHLEAKKKLQDKVTLSFGKGAFKWGWRLCLFCTSFVAISTTISVYRGKNGIMEYVAAGLVSGTLYKFNMGPRGWIVGGGLGATLGLIAGCATLGLLQLTGMSMEEVRYWQYHWKRARMDYYNKEVAKYLADEEIEVIRAHNKKVGEAGKVLENLEK